MNPNDGQTPAEQTETTDAVRTDRRSYLKLAGGLGLATAAGGFFSTTAAAETRHGMEFSRVVDVVDDLGVDPTGSQPVDGDVRSAATDGTLLVFPEGEYRWSRKNGFNDCGRIGFLGEGDVTFTFPQGFNDYFFVARTEEVLFENVTIDIEKDDTVTGMKLLCPNGFHVEDVEYVGRGDHSQTPIPGALFPYVTSEDATGTVKNLVAKKGSSWGAYRGAGGRGGIHVGPEHRGTVEIIDCHFEEFGNNGIYANGVAGDVQVTGGVYRNNNAGNVRLSGDGSFVDGALIEIDPDKYTGPRKYEDGAFNMRPIVVAQKPEKVGWKDAGLEVRNCDIIVKDNPSGTTAAIHSYHTGRSITIENTRIQMDMNGPAILRDAQQDTSRRPASPDPRGIQCRNVSITGDADGGAAVVLQDADGSEFVDSCLQQTGSNRDGLRIVRSEDCVVENSNINVTGTQLDTPNSDVSTASITSDASCPLPGSGDDATYSPPADSSEDDEGNSSSEDEEADEESDQQPADATKLEVVAADGGPLFQYEFETTDDVAHLTDEGDNAAEANNDGISALDEGGCRVSGATGNGYGDAFAVAGDVVSWSADTDAENYHLYADGEEVDPEALVADGEGETDEDETDASDSWDPRELTIVAADGGPLFGFEFTVAGEASLVTEGSGYKAEANNDAVTENDDGTVTVTGATGNGYGDAFVVEGEVLDWSADTDAENYQLLLDGEEVTPEELVGGAADDSDGASEEEEEEDSEAAEVPGPRKLTVVAADGGPLFGFEFTASVDASLVTEGSGYKAEANNDAVTENDDGTVTVTGATGNGYGDAFVVEGEIRDWSADTGAENYTLYVDDEEVAVGDL